MLLILTCLVLVIGTAIGGFTLFNRPFGHTFAIGIISVSIAATLIVTVVRYHVAISNAGYEELTSDTFRYLAYGRERWLTDTSCCGSAMAGDGTEGTLALSQLGFIILGDVRFAVFLAGSLIGLVGSWLFAISVKIIRPGSSIVYAFLFTLLPSPLYWSSSFGKEAFSQFAMGLAVLGLVILWRQPHSHTRFLGLASLCTAVLIAWIVRPEIAILIVAAAVVASVVVVDGTTPKLRRGLFFGTVLTLLIAFVLITIGVLNDPLGLVNDLVGRHDRTSLGESQLGAGRPAGIIGLAVGLPTAVFRPLPWEGGLAGLGSSLDTVVIAITVTRLWRYRAAWRSPRVAPARIIMFALVVVIVLFAPLAGYGNLGLLVRMRSLTVPLLLTIIALTPSLKSCSTPDCPSSHPPLDRQLGGDAVGNDSTPYVPRRSLLGKSCPNTGARFRPAKT